MDEELINNHRKYSERLDLFKRSGYDVERERKFIIDQAGPLHGRILEAGTGKGYFTLALAKTGRSFVTFDISADEQNFARLNLAYYGFADLAEFRIADAEQIGFPDGSYDMIFSVNVLHHLRQPYRAADEFLRLLSPQGRLVLADFTEVGFRIIEKIQAAEGKKHEAGKVRLSELELYLREKGLAVRRTASVIQDVLIGRKKII